MQLTRNAILGMLGLAAVTLVATNGATEEKDIKSFGYKRYDGVPVASHGFGFFDQLLTGRVDVTRVHSWKSGTWLRDTVKAVYIYPRGESPTGRRKIIHCWDGGPGEVQETRLEADRELRTAYGPGVPTFDPESGELRIYSNHFLQKGVPWYLHSSGWVQDTWPAVALKVCPNLPLPISLQINEKQTARTLEQLRLQDPEAPIKASRLSGREFLRWLSKHDGEIWTDEKGAQYAVLVAHSTIVGGPTGHWTGTVEVDATKELYRIAWNNDGRIEETRFDDPVRFFPTGRRHPVAQYLAIMTAADAPAIPLPDRSTKRLSMLEVRFRPDLTATVVFPDGSRAKGTWRMDAAEIVLSVPNRGDIPAWYVPSLKIWLQAAGLLE